MHGWQVGAIEWYKWMSKYFEGTYLVQMCVADKQDTQSTNL